LHFDSTISLGSIFAAITIVLAIVGTSVRLAGRIFALFEQVDRRMVLVERALSIIEPRTQMLYEAELRRQAVTEFIEKQKEGLT